MDLLKKLSILAFIIFVVGLFVWALYLPKKETAQLVQKTLEEQKKRMDLYFKEVTFEEISNGVKYWEIKAKTSSLNNDTGQAQLNEARGTFFEKGRPVLKFITPRALWNMKKKEIELRDCIGYDIKSELQVKEFLATVSQKGLSTFTLPARYKGLGQGYFFKAQNLSWDLASKKISCRGGIWLTKGDIIGTGKELTSDVGLTKVVLTGDPNITINNQKPINIKAREFSVDSPTDTLAAEGGVLITSDEMLINAQKINYFQEKNLIEILKEVRISYRDTRAEADQALYDVGRQKITLSENTKLIRRGSTLTGKNILVSLKDKTFKVSGQTKVVIPEKDLEEKSP